MTWDLFPHKRADDDDASKGGAPSSYCDLEMRYFKASERSYSRLYRKILNLHRNKLFCVLWLSSVNYLPNHVKNPLKLDL